MVDVIITNDKDDLQFNFKVANSFKNKKYQPSIDVPFIGASAANRLIFKFTGQAQDYSFPFVLYDDGVAVDNSTHTSPVITLSDQITYLMETFFVSDFDAEYTITVSSEGISATGTIESIELDTPTGGNIRTGTLTFKRGSLVGPI